MNILNTVRPWRNGRRIPCFLPEPCRSKSWHERAASNEWRGCHVHDGRDYRVYRARQGAQAWYIAWYSTDASVHVPRGPMSAGRIPFEAKRRDACAEPVTHLLASFGGATFAGLVAWVSLVGEAHKAVQEALGYLPRYLGRGDRCKPPNFGARAPPSTSSGRHTRPLSAPAPALTVPTLNRRRPSC